MSSQHGQMTGDEWIDAWVAEPNANPRSDVAGVPPIPRGAVVAFINGGIYCATAQEIDKVYAEHGSKAGTKIRKAMHAAIGDDDETVRFYSEATTFECALILAWSNSVIRDHV